MSNGSQHDALALWAGLMSDAGRLRQGCRFLDVGGGSGLLARAISALSGATGVLVDPDACRVPGFAAVRARADRLPLECGAFDAVILSHVLHHLEAPARAVAEAARVIAPGGYLLVRTASHDNLRALPHARWMPGLLSGILQGIPDVSVIGGYLTASGLALETVRTVHTLQNVPLGVYAESVAMLAFRNWAMTPGSGPDPRGDARAWALETFPETPPVPETLMIARKPFARGL